ncbi:hypothetical protein [Solimonas marina]|uniref:Lipoprotein n=1 Tax=Solimonas marina TaxID=2714601 RepID=A0A969WCH3_9GAMM|nr:hypothetical protein [Solimonas marina]NKF23674.1 hypothetical protein [Solimonas marina]
MNHIRLFAIALTLSLLGACASAPQVPPPPPCSGSCMTHEEGYQWAMRGALESDKPCDNKHYGPDFVRGCKDAVNDFSQMRPASTGL